MEKYDFSGWATKNDIRCADGKTIRQDAFKNDDGKTVPLVWNHQHDGPENVVGHALLENRKEGVWFYGKLNTTPRGDLARKLIESGDIKNVSIYANQIKQESGNVTHGVIRELSLVLAGANPGATIEYPIIQHSDGELEEVYDEAIIHTEEMFSTEDEEIEHADKEEPKENSGKTAQEIYDSMTDEQKALLAFLAPLIAKNMKESSEDDEDDDDVKHSDEGGEENVMKQNVFDNTQEQEEATLSQSAINTIFEDAKKGGRLSDVFLSHAAEYGIDGIEWLFPEDHELNTRPEFLKREPSEWVNVVMGGVHHTPFSRVRSTFADITEDEARARGYIKGKKKKEEVFSLLRRSTSPQTIYKKQRLDRDDIIDITDFDVVAWIKAEMRMMLNEEIARAILIGDGRLATSEDKIDESHVRPIANDADLYTIKYAVKSAENADDAAKARNMIRGAIKARKSYRGKGRPTMFTTSDWLTEMLLLEDNTGRPLYATETELATKLRVDKIVEVPVMEGAKISDKPLMGIIVNLGDYGVGADKGGEVNMFDDFDIDYNQFKYLIETRISGALTTPYSAIVLFDGEVPTSVDGGITYSKTTTAAEPTDGD